MNTEKRIRLLLDKETPASALGYAFQAIANATGTHPVIADPIANEKLDDPGYRHADAITVHIRASDCDGHEPVFARVADGRSRWENVRFHLWVDSLAKDGDQTAERDRDRAEEQLNAVLRLLGWDGAWPSDLVVTDARNIAAGELAKRWVRRSDALSIESSQAVENALDYLYNGSTWKQTMTAPHAISNYRNVELPQKIAAAQTRLVLAFDDARGGAPFDGDEDPADYLARFGEELARFEDMDIEETERGKICTALRLVPDADTDAIVAAIDRLRATIDNANETLAAYCPECDPGRSSLDSTVRLLIADVLEPELARSEHNREKLAELGTWLISNIRDGRVRRGDDSVAAAIRLLSQAERDRSIICEALGSALGRDFDETESVVEGIRQLGRRLHEAEGWRDNFQRMEAENAEIAAVVGTLDDGSTLEAVKLLHTQNENLHKRIDDMRQAAEEALGRPLIPGEFSAELVRGLIQDRRASWARVDELGYAAERRQAEIVELRESLRESTESLAAASAVLEELSNAVGGSNYCGDVTPEAFEDGLRMVAGLRAERDDLLAHSIVLGQLARALEGGDAQPGKIFDGDPNRLLMLANVYALGHNAITSARELAKAVQP